MISGLHHFELCVENGLKTLAAFTNKYGLRLVGKRETANLKQWMVRIARQKSVTPAFIITEGTGQGVRQTSTPLLDTWTYFPSERNFQDSVFNVALEIKNVPECTRRAFDNGAHIIKKPSVITDSYGEVEYSIVSPRLGNVVHTLINRQRYPESLFLPNFMNLENRENETDSQSAIDIYVDDIDHVSYVCNQGQSKDLINWYSNVFGMKRIFVNKNESETEGMVIDDVIGLRLKAMKYWLCAESGVESKIAKLSYQKNESKAFKFVFAESLYGNEKCHIEAFLKQHNGPGVQHIAFSSSNVIKTVAKMMEAGVEFRYPPACYYSQLDKAADIERCGENKSALQKHGILIDNEADIELSNSGNLKYLLQIFTKPIFNKETFFFEVIQRKGASGFGAGNILALAKSIEQQQQQEKLNMKQ